MRRTAQAPHSRWVTILTLLAFLLQGLAIQTHIHQPGPLSAVETQTGDAPKAPIKLDPVDHCRLCQELVHAGNFVAPSAAVAPASLIFVAAIFIALPAPPDRTATAFAWQSRGPPRR